jgi:hypothetical protein
MASVLSEKRPREKEEEEDEHLPTKRARTWDQFPVHYKSSYQPTPEDLAYLNALQAEHVAQVLEESVKQGLRDIAFDGKLFFSPLCYRNVDPALECVCGAPTQCNVVLHEAINGYYHTNPQKRGITKCPACRGDLIRFEYDEDDYPEEWADLEADYFCIDCRDLFQCHKA